LSKKRLLSSGFFSFFEKVVTVAAMLILTPSIIQSIGSDGYGLWLLILSVLAFFNIIELGFPAAVQRFVTLHLENDDKTSANRFLTVSLLLFAALGLISSSLAYLMFNTPALLGLDESMESLLINVALVFIFKIVMDFAMNPINAIYAAYLRVDIDAILAIINVFIKSLLIYYIGRHEGIAAMAICAVSTDVVVNAVKIFISRKIYPHWKIHLSDIDVNTFKELFNFSKYIIIMSIAKVINQRSAPIIISNLMSVKSVAIFGVAQNLINHADTLTHSIFNAFSAFFTQLVARGSEMTEYIVRTAKMCFLVSTLLAVNILLFSQSFITVWLGEDFAQAATVVSIMSFALLTRPYAMVFRKILIAQANHKNLMYVSLIGSVATLLLIFVLGSKYGIVGVALTFTLVSYLVQFFLFRIVFNQFNSVPLYRVDICFLISLVLCLVAFFASHFYPLFWINSWSSLVMSGILFNIVFLPCLAYLTLPKVFIVQIITLLKKKALRT
jgi:O-antigen/teichoic acid export membrane protein